MTKKRKVYIKGRGAFGRAYIGVYDAGTHKKITETRKTDTLWLIKYIEEKGFQVIDRKTGKEITAQEWYENR